ncbi:MAG: hypothetical protein E7172_00715 [Firmicutes bacterium]|nr:hypothetical protein [Bacillota bacterium]
MSKYKIYSITNKDDIAKLISFDKNNLIENFNKDILKVEIDHYEKYCFINLEEIYIFLDYKQAKKFFLEFN